jgi:pyruvate dehydrogenase E1 component
VWSVTSFSELARDGIEADRASRLHPTAPPRGSYVQDCLGASGVPVIAATDYVRSVPEQIRPWVGGPYSTLGTDGFGRSDYRRVLRRFFEVDRHHVTVAALHALGRSADAQKAIEDYDIDPEVAPPWTR